MYITYTHVFPGSLAGLLILYVYGATTLLVTLPFAVETRGIRFELRGLRSGNKLAIPLRHLSLSLFARLLKVHGLVDHQRHVLLLSFRLNRGSISLSWSVVQKQL